MQKLQKLVSLEEENQKLVALKEENERLKAQVEDLGRKLEASEKLLRFSRGGVLEWRQEIKDIEELKNPTRAVPATQSTQESNQLSLPFEKAGAKEKSDIVDLDVLMDKPQLEVDARSALLTSTPTFQDASIQTEGHELEDLKQKLENVMEEKVQLQLEMERCARVSRLDEYLDEDDEDSRWLAWVHKLQDKALVVSLALKALLKFAMKSEEDCKNVESSFWRLKHMFQVHPTGSTENTIWGDMDAMFERLNHALQDERRHINWNLEVEEGWIPYGTLSAHVKQNEKTLVHGCDPSSPLLTGLCSLCQGPYGPEGALTLGQCRHTFHVTCILKCALHRRECAECRSPLNARFYEVFGILEGMPPSHEYNRWTLPLDQGPYFFQSYSH